MSEKSTKAPFVTSPAGRALLLAARVILGGIFVYAAYAKVHYNGQWHVGDYQFLFAMGIDSYQMLPFWAVNWLATILPWLEVTLGALLILGVGLRWIGIAITALLLVFMTALTRASLLGLQINCGCFGNESANVRKELLLDVGLLTVALIITIGAFLTSRARRVAA